MCSWNWQNLLIMSFNFSIKKTGFSYINIRNKFILVFHDRFTMKFVFTCNISLVWLEINSKQKKIKSSRKEYVMWICFKRSSIKNIFGKLETNESWIIACLQIYRELLSLVTFLRVHSNSEEVHSTSLDKVRIVTWKLLVISS